jgi:hypothetical protein
MWCESAGSCHGSCANFASLSLGRTQPVPDQHGSCGKELINSLKIVTTLIRKIPPNLPLPKGGITPLW